jgi:hypothetical protein
MILGIPYPDDFVGETRPGDASQVFEKATSDARIAHSFGRTR